VGSLLPQPRRTPSFLDKRGCLVAGVDWLPAAPVIALRRCSALGATGTLGTLREWVPAPGAPVKRLRKPLLLFGAAGRGGHRRTSSSQYWQSYCMASFSIW
jgi:hypothetical protein